MDTNRPSSLAPEVKHLPAAEQQAAFASWLRIKTGSQIEIVGWEAPEGAGHSNETVLVETRSPAADGLSLVVRVQAAEPSLFPQYDLTLQCECMRQVAAHSDVPVPRVRWHEPSRAVFGWPFYVMDRIPGLVPADRVPYTTFGWLCDATPEEQATLFRSSLETLSEIHRIDWRSAGLQRLNRTAHGSAGLGQQFGWWRQYVDWVRDGRPQPTIDGATAWLSEHMPSPSSAPVLNWGDARLSNIMYRDFRPVAVLDWEMASVGPAEVDLAWFLFFQAFFSKGLGVDELPGFFDRAKTIVFYEKQLGRSMDDLHWYEAFAAWRHSALMLRIADLYESRGMLRPGSGAGQNNIATRMLAELVGLPSPGEPGGPFG